MLQIRDDVQLWQVDTFGGLEVLHASIEKISFPPHSHEEYFIAVTEGGRASPRFWGETQRIGPGDLFILSPGEVQSGGAATDSVWHYRSFYPPAALMQRVAQELTGSNQGLPRFGKEIIPDAATADLLRQVHCSFEEPALALARESQLLAALAVLFERHATTTLTAQRIGVEHRAVRRAKEFLDALPGENVTLDQLASESGLSAFHLCRVFRRETGLTPHAYQLQARVRLAKSLLAQGRSISDTALEAGFFDQAHLTKHFKRFYGVTPRRYADRTVDGVTGRKTEDGRRKI